MLRWLRMEMERKDTDSALSSGVLFKQKTDIGTKDGGGTREMSQWGKCLSHKHGDVSSNPLHPHKKAGCSHVHL